jgi:hypothetical protein
VRKDEKEARRLVRERSGGVCEICSAARATDWHHRRNRSQGGKWTAANGMDLCRSCHRGITDTREEFYTVGWLVRSWEDEQAKPVSLAAFGLVLLGNDGGWTAVDHVDA